MMKSQLRTDTQTRRAPLPEWQNDKGRKHEAFEVASLGCDRRSVARALRVHSDLTRKKRMLAAEDYGVVAALK